MVEKHNMNLKNYCERWYETLPGKASLHVMDELCAENMSGIFGYFALQMGELSGRHNLLKNSRIAAGFTLINKQLTKKQIKANEQLAHVDTSTDIIESNSLIISSNEQLPIETDNIDLVVASHVLEFSKDPHQVLREIDRVLVPEGHCILIGFNPFSLLRAGHFLKPATYKKSNPYKMRAAYRVKDWFSLLGFEVLDVQHFGFRPNIKNQVLFERLGWLENLSQKAWPVLGDLYMLHAKKQVIAMRPHKKVWKAPAVLTGGKVALNNTARKIRRQNFSN